MRVSITQLTTRLAVAALVALPASVAAQTPPSGPPAAQTPATSGSQSAAAPSTDAAREHLAKAKAALADVNTSTLSTRTKAQVTELNRRMNALERSVENAGSASGSSSARANTDWGAELGAIDKTLTALLGPESANATGTPSAVGTSGSASSTGAPAVDEATRAKLLEVRSHLTAFAGAMAGADPKTPAPSADPTTDPSAANAPATAAPTGTTGTSASSQAPTPAGTSGSTQTSGTQTSGTGQEQPQTGTQPAQPDEQAARRHLTDARNTLSALTQLPSAAQLSGDTRTQVSQLISNFNELITSQSNWRDAYSKVSANLNALIGAESGVTTDPTVSGTSGAVGTSGSTNLDPEIRVRLVELRRQLNEFEKAAAGGTAAAPGASAGSNPPAMDTNAPAPATAPSTTTPPTGTAPAGTTPPASTAAPGTQSTSGATGTTGTQPAGNAEIMRHIAAIEALLKAEDDSGGITLTRAQLEQLRTHLASLRQAVGR